jgi:hypothetical protein
MYCFLILVFKNYYVKHNPCPLEKSGGERAKKRKKRNKGKKKESHMEEQWDGKRTQGKGQQCPLVWLHLGRTRGGHTAEELHGGI